MSRRALLLAASLVLAASPLAAEGTLVIIVNVDSGITRMTPGEATNVFMGRQKRLASGVVAIPMELNLPTDLRDLFYKRLIHLPLSSVRAYWARLLFSGQAQPPRLVDSAEEMIELVAANKGAVGFLEKDKLSRRVRAVLELGAEPGS